VYRCVLVAVRGCFCIRPRKYDVAVVFTRAHTVHDAWGLGHILWGMLSPDAAAAPVVRGGYVEPPGTVGGRAVDVAAAAAIVRGLLRAAPGERWSLDEAVACLEATLFVLPGLESPRISRRCVCELVQRRAIAWAHEGARVGRGAGWRRWWCPPRLRDPTRAGRGARVTCCCWISSRPRALRRRHLQQSSDDSRRSERSR
jgi:hypothetical protein